LQHAFEIPDRFIRVGGESGQPQPGAFQVRVEADGVEK
jgi:hypothetical protein